MFTNDPVTGDLFSSAVVADDDGSGGLWAGLGGLFGTIGTTIGQVYQATNPVGPRPITPGTYYNPNTGQIQNVGGLGASLGGNSGLLLLVGGGLLLVLLLRRK